MNRPVYETDADLLKEDRIKRTIEQKWKADLHKLPIKYHADFLALRDDTPVGLIEIKIRDNDSTKYPTYMLSLHKAVNCLATADIMNIPFVLVVFWNDMIGYIQVTDEYFKVVKMQESNFRNDVGDIEPCIHIPINDFKKL